MESWPLALFLAIVTVNSAHTLVRENAHTYTLMSPVNSIRSYRVNNRRTLFLGFCTSMQSYRLRKQKNGRFVIQLRKTSLELTNTHTPTVLQRSVSKHDTATTRRNAEETHYTVCRRRHNVVSNSQECGEFVCVREREFIKWKNKHNLSILHTHTQTQLFSCRCSGFNRDRHLFLMSFIHLMCLV